MIESSQGARPALTLVIPLYETPATFLREIHRSISLLGNSENLETLLIVDSPSPNFVHKVREIFSDVQNVVIKVNESNMGRTYSYARGFVEARGLWVTLMDHDDICDLNEKRLNELKYFYGSTVDLLYTNEFIFNSTSRRIVTKPDFDFLSALQYFYTHHFTFYRRDKINIDLENLPKTECFDIYINAQYILDCLKRQGKVRGELLSWESAYGWRNHSGSTASNPKQKNLTLDRIEATKFVFKSHKKEIDIKNSGKVSFLLQFRSLHFFKDFQFDLVSVNSKSEIESILKINFLKFLISLYLYIKWHPLGVALKLEENLEIIMPIFSKDHTLLKNSYLANHVKNSYCLKLRSSAFEKSFFGLRVRSKSQIINSYLLI